MRGLHGCGFKHWQSICAECTNLYCGQNGILKLSVRLPYRLPLGHMKSDGCGRSLKDGPHLLHPTWWTHATDRILGILKPDIWAWMKQKSIKAQHTVNWNAVALCETLTDIIFDSLLKELIHFVTVGFLLSQTNLILEPIEPDLCRIIYTTWLDCANKTSSRNPNSALTFSEWEKFTHLLPCFSQSEKFSLLL